VMGIAGDVFDSFAPSLVVQLLDRDLGVAEPLKQAIGRLLAVGVSQLVKLGLKAYSFLTSFCFVHDTLSVALLQGRRGPR
jgi:hypothetical protein